ncbi:MAG TPA: hypothetical protein PLU72_13395, partial [Candidatus Ozemobacteraceae bacterium]|nr:hypothetical protein [Candidatus Ozemobacteraceae bacterium]
MPQPTRRRNREEMPAALFPVLSGPAEARRPGAGGALPASCWSAPPKRAVLAPAVHFQRPA